MPRYGLDIARVAGLKTGTLHPILSRLLQAGLIESFDDGAGVIESVGEGVDPSRIGGRVWLFDTRVGRPPVLQRVRSVRPQMPTAMNCAKAALAAFDDRPVRRVSRFSRCRRSNNSCPGYCPAGKVPPCPAGSSARTA